ncbi:MAG: hypothetical protein LC739_12820 [Actinobacteria bacterium]|nr:hypothetical protein [Actinomycetota bacterium]
MEPRNPRAEATSLLPSGCEARVLEPSPPANTDPAWYADDPTDPSDATGHLVTPIPGEGTSWTQMATEHPELTDFAASHWLGCYRRLQPLPEGYDSTRRALHQLAFFAVAPKRHAATGKIGLRYTHGGFGTPFFAEGEQVRVEGGMLIRQAGESVSQARVITLSEACVFVEIPYRETWFEGFRDPLEPVGADTELLITQEAADAHGDWFGFGASVLEQVRRTEGAPEVGRLQLWPEHFDLGFEMGSGSHRATYGASPGDDRHPEPYLYVSPWEAGDKSNPFWNDRAFNGASLSYRILLESDDQHIAARDFYEHAYRLLG